MDPTQPVQNIPTAPTSSKKSSKSKDQKGGGIAGKLFGKNRPQINDSSPSSDEGSRVSSSRALQKSKNSRFPKFWKILSGRDKTNRVIVLLGEPEHKVEILLTFEPMDYFKLSHWWVGNKQLFKNILSLLDRILIVDNVQFI